MSEQRTGHTEDLSIESLAISVRTHQLLRASGAATIRDILNVPQTEWMRVFRIGRKSANEIEDALFPCAQPGLIRYNQEPSESRSRLTCVYFIRCGAFVKIGVARDAESRLYNLQISNPDTLELLLVVPCEGKDDAVVSVERQFHKRFGVLRHRGEWFRYEGELRDYVEGLRAARTE